MDSDLMSFELSPRFPVDLLTQSFPSYSAFHAASAAVLIVVLSTITTMYLSSVRRLIQKAKQELIESDSGRGRELLDRVRRTWKVPFDRPDSQTILD